MAQLRLLRLFVKAFLLNREIFRDRFRPSNVSDATIGKLQCSNVLNKVFLVAGDGLVIREQEFAEFERSNGGLSRLTLTGIQLGIAGSPLASNSLQILGNSRFCAREELPCHFRFQEIRRS